MHFPQIPDWLERAFKTTLFDAPAMSQDISY